MPVVQIPTTPPTLDEMIGLAARRTTMHERLLAMTAGSPRSRPFTLHAELEGMLLPVMERLLAGWREQGYELISTGKAATASMSMRRHFARWNGARWPAAPAPDQTGHAVSGESGKSLRRSQTSAAPQPARRDAPVRGQCQSRRFQPAHQRGGTFKLSEHKGAKSWCFTSTRRTARLAARPGARFRGATQAIPESQCGRRRRVARQR